MCKTIVNFGWNLSLDSQLHLIFAKINKLHACTPSRMEKNNVFLILNLLNVGDAQK